MAALQCEICGGKLIGKPGGVFECDSCGMEYSTEWAKAKVQEIKGTVKIEGPVEVTGTVKVEGGGPSTESLLKRANMLLSELNWEEAKKYCNQVLEMEPENAEAYLGLVMADRKCGSRTWFADTYIEGGVYNTSNLSRARQFAGPELKSWLDDLEKQRQKAEARNEAKRQAEAEELVSKRKLLTPATALICSDNNHTVGLRADGTVVAVANPEYQYGQCNVSDWHDIVAVAAGGYHAVGLKSDGTVVATGSNKKGQCDVSGWRNIVAVAAGLYQTVGLKMDGTVLAVGGSSDRYGAFDVSDWTDIVAVAAGDGEIAGVKSDGTVVAAGDNSFGRCDVTGWKLFDCIDTLERERTEARVEYQRLLEAEKQSVQAEIANCKGLFSGGKRKELEARLAQIEKELNAL